MSKLSDYRLTLRGKEYYPLMVGGMGVDISTSELALEAARLGAIGHISDAMSPFVSDRKFRTTFQSDKLKRFKSSVNSLDKTNVKWDVPSVYQATLNHVQSTMEKKQASSGAVFINVMEKLQMGAPSETLRARIAASLDGGIDGITLSAGLHKNTLKLIEDLPRFRDVAIGVIVSSVRALKIFLRSSSRTDRMPDYVIVEGPLAGGHLGFGLDWFKFDLPTIVAEVRDFLNEEGLSIPIIPAGGVFTGTDAVNYVQLGASAVQVATRFTISKECGLPEKVKQEYAQAKKHNVIVNMASPTGYPMRMLSSSPCLRARTKPQCEALGYILDADGRCQYHEAYSAMAEADISCRKMCICYHFMKFDCYTCGQNVYRLKDTTLQLADGSFFLPPAEHIINDYLHSQNCEVLLPKLALNAALISGHGAANGKHAAGASSPEVITVPSNIGSILQS